MPFTPSHAVVALPFVRTPLPFGAVAVGSMAPDVPLFFPVGVTYDQTHGFPSLLLVSVPVALLLYLVWRLLLRPASRVLLPTPIGSRLPVSWDLRDLGPARQAPWMLLAVALGVVTHVFWDVFTHPDRLGSSLVPALADPWGPLVGTQWLQYLSSVGGLVVLSVAGSRHLRRTPPARLGSPSRIRPLFWASLAAALVVGVVATTATRGLPTDLATITSFVFFAGTLAGALVLLATAAAAAAVQFTRRRVARVEHP